MCFYTALIRGENNMLTGWAIAHPVSKLFCPPSKLLPKIAHPVNYCARKQINVSIFTMTVRLTVRLPLN